MHLNKFQSDSAMVLSLGCTWRGPGEYIIGVIWPYPGKSDVTDLGLGSRHWWL